MALAERIEPEADAATGLTPFAPRLFVGHVMHLRLRPKRHQFRYSVFCLWADLDRMETELSGLRLLARRGWGVFGLHAADHGPRSGAALRPWVDARLAEAGLAPAARVMLLAFPRVLGFVFNPLSVYYCYDASDRLFALVYEVKNTFGDQHAYAAGVETDGAEHQADKRFFVSPFIDMAKRYHFTAPPPGERLALRIKERDGAGDYLIATWNGAAEPLTDANLARRFFSHPMMTLKVILGIHWEAARLALKGVRFLGHPGADGVLSPAERGAPVSEARHLVGGEARGQVQI
ncbi:MAG: DUF1365 domain-containing protein [Pseudomonadota bacterium]